MNRSVANKSTVAIKRVSTQAELVQALAIRIRVFVREQRVPAEIELDADDRQALHLLALKSGKAVGTARVVLKHGKAKIGRMAVLKSHRRRGVGAALLQHAIALAKRRKATQVYLNAQVAVIGFYASMGFRAVGKVFDEAAISHRRMIFADKIGLKREQKTAAGG
jgi:ElaA protein